MPIYEYKCSDCLHQFEKIQKFSEQSIKTCPVCNKDNVSKLISAPSFRLKGSGWYETDFKTKGQRNISGDGDKKEAPASEKGGSNVITAKEANKGATLDNASE